MPALVAGTSLAGTDVPHCSVLGMAGTSPAMTAKSAFSVQQKSVPYRADALKHMAVSDYI